jgi:hypothetical protein
VGSQLLSQPISWKIFHGLELLKKPEQVTVTQNAEKMGLILDSVSYEKTSYD